MKSNMLKCALIAISTVTPVHAQSTVLSSSGPCSTYTQNGPASCLTVFSCTNGGKWNATSTMIDQCPGQQYWNEANTAAYDGYPYAVGFGSSFVGIYPTFEWQLRSVSTQFYCTGTSTETIEVLGTCSGPSCQA
jgi:hypothetical protein